MDHSDMERLWDGLDTGTFTTTSQENESNGDKDSGNEDRGNNALGRSDEAKGTAPRKGTHSSAMRGSEVGGDGYAFADHAFADHAFADGDLANGTEQQNKGNAAHPSTLLGLPEGTNAGEVILVNKRDIMVLQFMLVRLVEKGIMDAEEVIRMKKDANQQIRESHPDITEKQWC